MQLARIQMAHDFFTSSLSQFTLNIQGIRLWPTYRSIKCHTAHFFSPLSIQITLRQNQKSCFSCLLSVSGYFQRPLSRASLQVLIKIRGSARCLIYKIGFKSGNQNEIDMYFEPEDDLIKSNLSKSKKSEYDDAISE